MCLVFLISLYFWKLKDAVVSRKFCGIETKTVNLSKLGEF